MRGVLTIMVRQGRSPGGIVNIGKGKQKVSQHKSGQEISVTGRVPSPAFCDVRLIPQHLPWLDAPRP